MRLTRLSSVCCALATLAAALLACPTVADEAKPLLEAPLVDWSVAKAVYAQADKWVKEDKVERDPTARPILVSGVVGVRVTLRFGGLMVGEGDALTDITRPNAPADLRELVAKATEFALVKYHDARDQIGRPRPDAKEKAPVRVVKPTAHPIDVDLQILHSPTEIVLTGDARDDAVYYQFAVSAHGLRMITRDKTPRSAILWPASAIALNLKPDNQIARLLTDVGYGVQDVITISPKIARESGPRLQRLDCLHLVRPFDSQPIAQLTRGNEIIPIDAVDLGMIESMTKRLTQHLLGRVVAEEKNSGTLTGTYHPTSDRYDPVDATPAEAALAAYAIARRTAQLAAIDPDGLDYLDTRTRLRIVIDQLRRTQVSPKKNEADVDAQALLLLTLVESPFLAEMKADRDRLGARLLELPVAKGFFLSPLTGKPFGADSQALLLTAMAALYEQTRDEKLAPVIEAGLDALWASKLDEVDLVNAMPWMSGAALRMHRVNLAQQTDDRAKAFERARWAARLRAMRELAENLRKKKLVRGTPAIGPADVVGGYDLLNKSGDGAPTPDWRSAHILAFLAQVASDKEIMEGESINRFRLDAVLTVRFIAQLMLDEPSAYYVRGMAGGRRDAIDGVRFALWDNRQAVKPSAMSLIALTELQAAAAAMK